MQFRLPRKTSPDGDSRPSTPAEVKNGWRGRTIAKASENVNTSTTEGSVEPDLHGRLPQRTNSFGLGLGGLQSLASGMSRAGESLSRKTTGPSSEGTKTPPVMSASSSVNPTHGSMGPPMLPDSSYLARFSLRLTELVNRAFMTSSSAHNTPSTPISGGLSGAAKNAAAMSSVISYQGIPSLNSITYEGKKLPSKAVITEIAKTVVKELEYASSVDPYLLRAASRSALKALSLFADRIDSLYISPSKDPSVNFVPSNAKEGIHIPASLEFNLGLITLEWIVEDALERCIEGPPGTIDQGMPHFVSEILTPVRKKMEGTILHTIQPLMSNVKNSLTQCITKAVPMPFSGFGHGLSPVPSLTSPLVESTPPTPSGVMSPSGNIASSWLRELDGRLDGCRRLLIPRIEERCGQDGEGWFISVAIHLIWKGLLTLTSKTMPMPQHLKSRNASPHIAPIAIGNVLATEAHKRSPSPAQLTNALKSVNVKPRKKSGAGESSSGVNTPSHVATSVGLMPKATLQQVQELQAFEKLVMKFAAGFEPSKAKTDAHSSRHSGAEESSSSSEEESDDDDEDELARAALAEALQAIKSVLIVIPYLDTQPENLLEVIGSHHRHRDHLLPLEVIRAAKATPHLLLMHLIYSRMPTHLATFASVIAEGGKRSEPVIPSPPAVFAYTWSEYERAIVGFAGGQSWAYALVDAWKEDVIEAEQLLNGREGKIARKMTDGLTVEQTAIDPLESTPTPQSVLLHRTVSAQSDKSDDEESISEAMTASAPTLDREKVKIAATGGSKPSTMSLNKVSTWNSLRQTSRLKSPSQSSDISDISASPETSPPRSPNAQAAQTNGSITNEAAKSKRFWRSQTSLVNAGGGFHLMGVGRNSAAKSASASLVESGSTLLSEEDRLQEDLQEEIRVEREGLNLLKRVIEVVDASRKPRLLADNAHLS